MECKIFTKIEEFDNIRNEYNAYLEDISVKTPYMTFSWLTSWWKHFCKGKDVKIFTFWENGRLLGIIPLYVRRIKFKGLPAKKYELLGGNWGLYNLDFNQDIAESFIRTVNQKTDFQIIDLALLHTNGQFASLKNNNNHIVSEQLISVIPLNETWENYLAQRSKNFRKVLRKKMNKLNSLGKVEFKRESPITSKESLIRTVSAISQRSWQGREEKAVAASQSGRDFYISLLDSDEFKLDLSWLELNGQAIAYQLGIRYENYFYAYDTGFDEKFSEISPGTIVISNLLQELCNQNINEFILGLTQPYMTDFTETQRKAYQIRIFRPSLYGFLLRSLEDLAILVRKRFNRSFDTRVIAMAKPEAISRGE